MDADGTRAGYDVEMLTAVRAAVSVPVIASGGAGRLEDFAPAVEAGADAVLAASVFHFGQLRSGRSRTRCASSRPRGPRMTGTVGGRRRWARLARGRGGVHPMFTTFGVALLGAFLLPVSEDLPRGATARVPLTTMAFFGLAGCPVGRRPLRAAPGGALRPATLGLGLLLTANATSLWQAHRPTTGCAAWPWRAATSRSSRSSAAGSSSAAPSP